jgi:hypothetical protein
MTAISPTDAWNHGSNIRGAMRLEPKLTHVALMSLLKDAIEYLDFNKTITGTQNFIDAVNYLVETFPVMKIEEWKVIMVRLKSGKYGKMYERLKLPELVEIFQQYEGERAEMMEQEYRRDKDSPAPPLSDEQRSLMKRLIVDLKLPEDDTDDKGRWTYIQHPNTTE